MFLFLFVTDCVSLPLSLSCLFSLLSQSVSLFLPFSFCFSSSFSLFPPPLSLFIRLFCLFVCLLSTAFLFSVSCTSFSRLELPSCLYYWLSLSSLLFFLSVSLFRSVLYFFFKILILHPNKKKIIIIIFLQFDLMHLHPPFVSDCFRS